MADREELIPQRRYLFYPPTLALLGVILTALYLWVQFLVLPGIRPAFDYPVDAKGTVILDEHNWAESVSLLVPWNFYWNRRIEPEAFVGGSLPSPDCRVIPGYWGGETCGSHELQSVGEATYHLRVKVKAQSQDFAFHFLRAFMSYRLYVNGQLIIQQGDSDRPHLEAVRFGAGSEVLDIVLYVKNPEYLFGGVYSRIRLGLADQVAHERYLSSAIEVGIGACFFIMALYHFAFFCLRRRSIELLMFAGICALILWRIAFVGQSTYFDIMNIPRDEHLILWSMYMTYFAELPMFAVFIYALFPKDLSLRFTLTVVGISAIALLNVALLPMNIWMYTVIPYNFLAVTYVIYAYYSIARVIILYRREGAILFGLGGSIVSLGLLYDIGVLIFNFKTFDNISTLGLFVFLLVQALVLARRFSRAYQLVEAGERAIKSLNADLREHERARTVMFQNTSHELRTPLNGILGFIRLIHSGQYGEIAEKPRAQLLKVENLARSLLSQVNTILDLAKSRQGSLTLAPTMFSLNELVKEVSYLSEALQTRQQEVSFEIIQSWNPSTESPVFVGDQEKILTIFRNLLGNAFKFAKKGQAHHVSIGFELRASGLLCIKVQDTGIGIPPEYIDKIFEEFRQVDDAARRSYEGTGLGLAITKSFVQLMGGKIEVNSDLGFGSTFKVEIPTAHPQDHTAIVSGSRVRDEASTRFQDVSATIDFPLQGFERPLIAKNNRRILVIDDNPINCELIKDILEPVGYTVGIALGGAEGLQMINAWKPDIILLDLMMPTVSGEDVLQQLRANTDQASARIPVILITARASQDDRIHGLSLGADDYLAKPIMSEEMILRVRNSINRLELTHKAAEKAAIEQDLAAVQMINERISRSLIDFPSYSFASFYQPAELTGGDWLGVFHDQERQRLYLMIGDVTGHGMKSALVAVIVAAAIKGGIEVLKKVAGDEKPDTCLKVLRDAANRLMCDVSEQLNKSMTMAFLSIDIETGEGFYLNAGHPPVCILRADKVATLVQRSVPLGYDKGTSEDSRSFHLGLGDSLLLFTDGLTDNSGPEGNSLSLRRLCKKIVGQASADAVKEIIIAEFQSVVRNQKAYDDTCFCVISRKREVSDSISAPLASAS